MWIKAQNGCVYNAAYLKMIQVEQVGQEWRIEADQEGKTASYITLATYADEESARRKFEESSNS